MNNKVGIVLIHGAGLGSWIWGETVKHLQTESLAIDFPGRNNESGANKALTLNDYCTHILDSIQDWDNEQIVLAAHSIGGVVALKLADQLGDRVVFLTVLSELQQNCL